MTNDIYNNLDMLKNDIAKTISSVDMNFVDSTPEINCSSAELDFFIKNLLPSVFSSISNKMDLYLKHTDQINRYLAECSSKVTMVSYYNKLDPKEYNLRIDTCINIANQLVSDINKIAGL